MKKIEGEVNKRLKEEGLSSIKLVYGNGVYPKVKKDSPKTVTLKGVWINAEKKTFSAAMVGINSEIYIVLERTIYIHSHKLGKNSKTQNS